MAPVLSVSVSDDVLTARCMSGSHLSWVITGTDTLQYVGDKLCDWLRCRYVFLEFPGFRTVSAMDWEIKVMDLVLSMSLD